MENARGTADRRGHAPKLKRIASGAYSVYLQRAMERHTGMEAAN